MNKKLIITISVAGLLLIGLSVATLILVVRDKNDPLVFREEKAPVKMHITDKTDIIEEDRSSQKQDTVNVNTIGNGWCSLPTDNEGVPLVVSEQPDRPSVEIEEIYNVDDVLVYDVSEFYHSGKKYLTMYFGYEADGSSVINGYTAYVYRGDRLYKRIIFDANYENLDCKRYTYDASGRVVKTSYAGDGYRGQSFDTHTWSVTDSGHEEVIRYHTYDEDIKESESGFVETRNTYEEGKLIATTQYKKSSETGGLVPALSRAYTYDKDRLVKVEKFSSLFGERYLVWYKDYRYSVFGYLVETRQYEADGSLLGYSLYTSLHADPGPN